MRKIAAILILTLLLPVLLSSCYDAREIDDEVYAVALGLDKGKDNRLSCIFQYPTYKGGGGPGGGGSAGGGEGEKASEEEAKLNQSDSNIQIIEAPTYLEAVDILSMSLSRRVSLIHAKWIIFSEELAREGIESFMSVFHRFRELRPSVFILITKGKAEDFIISNKTYIGSSINKSMELLLQQSRYSGYFPMIQFNDFYISFASHAKQPSALYAGVNDLKKLKEEEASGKNKIKPGEGFLPGDIPRLSPEKREIAGMALFHSGQMVGTLNSYETTYYMMLTGEFKNGRVTIEDKNAPGQGIIFNLNSARKPKIKGKLVDNNPVFDIKVSMEAEIYGIQSRIPYDDLSRQVDIKQQITDYLRVGMEKTIQKTQQYNSDVIGFGQHLSGKFFTIQEWEAYQWFSKYKDAQINLDLEVNIRRTGLQSSTHALPEMIMD